MIDKQRSADDSDFERSISLEATIAVVWLFVCLSDVR